MLVIALALIMTIFAIGGLAYVLLGQNMFVRFGVTEPIRGAVVSLMGVLAFALVIGIIITIVGMILRGFHFG